MSEEEEIIIIGNPPVKPKFLGVTLVSDCHLWARWWSVRLSLLATAFAAVPVVYATFPADWLPVVPAWMKATCAVGAMWSAFGAALARPIAQDGLRR